MAASPRLAAGPRRPGLAMKLVMACAATAITLVVIDVVLRLALNSAMYQMAWPEIPELSRFTRNAEEDEIKVGDLGALTSDTRDDVARRVRIRTDAYGFRNQPEAAQRPVNLIVLGDSYGFGTGTTQDRIVASLIRDREGFLPYNLSMPHTGPWEQYLNLALESGRMRLRQGAVVLWVIFSGNDLDDAYGSLDVERMPRAGLAGRMWTIAKRTRARSPVYQFLRRARYAVVGAPLPGTLRPVAIPFVNGRVVLFAPPYVEARKRRYQDVTAHANYAALAATVRAMKTLTDRLGASLKIVLAPSKEEVYGWMIDGAEPWSTPVAPTGFGLALREIAEGARIDFLDVTPVFVEESRALFARSGGMLWWSDDTHWSEQGHALAASVIDRQVLGRAGLSAGVPR